MKALLVITIAAIIYSWYLSRNKIFINRSLEEYKTKQEKIDKRNKRRNQKPKRNKKRRRKLKKSGKKRKRRK
jgi:Flp pilus assembly protein TadB